MKILFIAPLPPPITGHSIVSKALLDELDKDYVVAVVNLSKDSFKEGLSSIKRIIDVIIMLCEVWYKKKNADAIYLTISESLAGNLKDLLIYLICFRSLSKMYIHLHGGSIKRLLWDRHGFLLCINKIFINKLAGVIISGKSHIDIFDGMIHRDKLYIVPNFAPDDLFLTEDEIRNKFSSTQQLRVLYLSNFIPQKGYNELIDAYLKLGNTMQRKVRIDFAGRFDSVVQENIFLKKIEGIAQIHYHGVVDDFQKRALFSEAHIFCLPTSFFEGQPISILEAYAAGCAVLTTGQAGIRDIFQPGINGFEIEEKSSASIKLVLAGIIEKPENLLHIAISNRMLASEKYRISIYNASMKKIIVGKTRGQI
jgi:glycosyltransferase involved in cell wall biosynthesis